VVTGKVQGVFFRKCTKQEADRLGVSGWCRNSADGESVEGELEGIRQKVDEMITWLRVKGSPHSMIQSCEVETIPCSDEALFNSFDIRK